MLAEVRHMVDTAAFNTALRVGQLLVVAKLAAVIEASTQC